MIYSHNTFWTDFRDAVCILGGVVFGCVFFGAAVGFW